jgi:5-methylcytosine-specific restriction endonuclease McrA
MPQYLASEIFLSLPKELRALSYSKVQNDAGLALKYSVPLSSPISEALLSSVPPSVGDSLSTYLSKEPAAFLLPPLEAYISSAAAPPPIWATTRASACELCERSHIPLTYHHLIPRAVHAKVIKRGWHEEWELNKVAWLCRACHSFIHRVCAHEELARDFDTVEKLIDREDVQGFVKWVGRVRWKAR